jgi:hypothetical protein
MARPLAARPTPATAVAWDCFLGDLGVVASPMAIRALPVPLFAAVPVALPRATLVRANIAGTMKRHAAGSCLDARTRPHAARRPARRLLGRPCARRAPCRARFGVRGARKSLLGLTCTLTHAGKLPPQHAHLDELWGVNADLGVYGGGVCPIRARGASRAPSALPRARTARRGSARHPGAGGRSRHVRARRR